MDVFLSEIDCTFDSLDILMSPVQFLALGLNLLKFCDHNLSLFDSIIDANFKLTDEFLDVVLHILHGLLVNSLDQVALDLKLLLGQFAKLLIFDLDLAHETSDKSMLDFLLT